MVAVNGQPVSWVTDFYERADVTKRWPEYPHTATAGWTAVLDLTDYAGTDAVISAYALLESVPGSPRLGPVLHVGTASCSVEVDERATRVSTGHLHQPPSVPPGFVRIHGHVQAVDDVATVELVQDGRSAGLARTTPIGTIDGGLGVLFTSTRFDGVVQVAGTATSTVLAAEVTLTSGERFEIDPWEPRVVATVMHSPRPDAARLDVVRRRAQARLEAQVAARPPLDPAVLLVTHDLALGGGQLYLHELVRRLHRRGMRFALASPRSGVLTDELEAMGIPVLITGETQVRDPEHYETQVLAVASFAVEHGCATTLANTVNAFLGVDAGLRLGLPTIWAIHESYPFGQFWMEAYGADVAHPYVVDRARASLGRASRVVFEAQETLRFYEPVIAPGAGVVVPYGVDLGEISRFRDEVDREKQRAELGIGPDTLALLCMGTIEPRKGQLNLAQAFAGSRRLRDSDCELIFVGAIPGAQYADGAADASSTGSATYGSGSSRSRPTSTAGTTPATCSCVPRTSSPSRGRCSR